MSEGLPPIDDPYAIDRELMDEDELVPKPPRKGPRALLVALLISVLVVLGVWRWGLGGQEAAQGGIVETADRGGPASQAIKREPLTLVGVIWLEDFPEGHLPTAPPLLIAPPNEDCRVRAWKNGARLAAVDTCIGGGNYELEFDGEAKGTVAVEIWAAGYLRAVVEIELEGRGRVELPELALGRGHVVAGQVLNAAREPVAGAVIEGRPNPDLDEPIPWRTVSDEAGNFRFDNMPYGPVTLRGRAAQHADSVVEAVAPTDDVLLIMEALMDLRGTVITERERLKDARARVEGSGVWPPVEVQVDKEGNFVFPGLIDGVYGVEVYVLADPDDKDGPRLEYASIPLENVEPTMKVTLALIPAFRVLAKVVDPDGNPVPDARVTLSNARIGMLQKIETTDLVGQARPGPVVPGPYWLRADADGYLPAPPVPVDVDAKTGAPKEATPLVLSRPATLAGVVLDEDDKAVAGAEVRLESDELFTLGEVEARADLVRTALRMGEEGMGSLGVTTGPVPPIPRDNEPDMISAEAWLSTLTDEAGNFRFEMLVPGGYHLVARDGSHAESKELALELKSGELRDELVLRLREGAPLTGRVLDANGQPLREVIIEAAGEFFVSDETGSFDLGLRQGRVRLVARAPGFVPQEITAKVKDAALDLELRLEPADGAVDLRLVDPNGTPIANVEVVLQSKDGLSPTVIAWSDEAGRVQLEELTPGKSTLRLGHPDYVMQEMSLVVDHRIASLELREIKLDAGWTLEVIVRANLSGERLEGAGVLVDGRGGQSDKDGKLVIAHLDAKRVEVKVSLAGWAPSSAKVKRPKKGSVAELVLELEEVGSLEGTLRDDIGDPVVGASVRALDPKGRELASVSSTKGGVFVFEALPQGALILEALPPPSLEETLLPLQFESDVRRRETTSEVHLRFERR